MMAIPSSQDMIDFLKTLILGEFQDNKQQSSIAILLDLLRKYPEDLQFPNEIRKPNPKKRQGIQTAHRCNARPFS